MDDIYELFGKFELELLPKDWVESLIKDDFSEAIDFPIEYDEFIENTDIAQLMLVACKYIKDWLESGIADISIASTSRASLNSSQISSKSWQDLKSHNVHHKALISMLSIFILRGKTEQQFEHKRLGLIASDLYFMLLAIPGCEVFHIFNPILYSHAMENLKICSIFDSPSKSAKKKPAKKQRGRQDDDSFEEDEEEEEMATDTGREDLSSSEKSIVLELLINVLNDLIFSLQRFQLKGQDDSLLITIQILILLTRVEKTSSLILTRTPSSKNLSHLAYKAYQILFKLCRPNNGDVSEICRMIVKEMMPAFLIFCSDGLKIPVKEALVIKDHSLQFVRNLLLTIKEPAFNSVLTLTQFVMSKIPDKADLRAKGVQVVLELMGVLPDPVFARAVVWTLTFSLNDQVKYRVTALEIITKLLHESERPPPLPDNHLPSPSVDETRKSLTNGHESEEDTTDKSERPSKSKSSVSEAHYSTHKFLLAAIFDRCLDSASSVRSKALSILSSLFTTNNKRIKEELESIFTTPYLNGANEELNETHERSFCKFLHLLKNRKTAKSPPPNPLPGAKAVIQTIEMFIMDDKVFVRKAALQVLSNIFILNERWMTTKLLQLLIDYMRDVSVMVKKLLVQCLTDLLLHYPSHSELPKFWVLGVMLNINRDPVWFQLMIDNMRDVSVMVRKLLVQCLTDLLLHYPSHSELPKFWVLGVMLNINRDPVWFQLMIDNMRDVSVMVRKLLVQCLTDLLLHYPSHSELPKFWVLGVMLNINRDPVWFQLMIDNMRDVSVMVRKLLVQCLTDLLLHYPSHSELPKFWVLGVMLNINRDPVWFQLMIDNMRDVSVMVRKLLVQCLTDLLLHYPSHSELPKFWVLGVMLNINRDTVWFQLMIDNMRDVSVMVRKLLVQCLTDLLLHYPSHSELPKFWVLGVMLNINRDTVWFQLMIDNMRDVSVMVRKLLVQCLTDLLLHYPSHSELPKFWVLGVMPLLMEDEIKAQEKVLEMLQKVVLDNLVAYNQMKTPLHSLPWIVLDLIVLNSQKLFSKAFDQWAKNKSFRQNMITTIKTHIGTENNSTAWYLLASLSEYINIKDPQFVIDYFYESVLNTQQVDEYCCQLVTEVMYMSCKQLPKISQVQLCETLLKHLSQFTIPLPMIARCVDICHLVTETQADPPAKGRKDTEVWATVLIHTCENRLEKVIGPDSPKIIEDDQRLCQYILTLGEACQICPEVMKESTLDLIENLLANRENYPEYDDTAFYGKLWRGKVSAAVQGFAVITLGKLCLQKAKTANILVPLLGSLLSCSPHAEIKINAMIALTDMCIKYTSMVENFLPAMCMCLKDKRLPVRENTLKLLIQMIQEDYLKLRCPMFFHILTMLLDDEKNMREMTSSFIINSLLKKKKDALVQHFVEALLHYNAYLEHATYARLEKMSPRERALFSLEGPENQEKRRSIYRFMLENMMDDQRFKVTHRLCNDILSEVAEGNIKLTSSGMTLLQDALYVLSCDEIRFSQLKRGGKEDDDDGGEEAQVNQAFQNLARKTLINEVMKKNFIDNVVPTFIKLKYTLQQMKSPLVRDLMACLRELMKDYKQEIDEILSADKELAAEISHDIKALEGEECEEERQSEASESVTEVFKKVMELSVHRKGLNSTGKSPRKSRSTRLSTSSVATMNSENPAVSPKSQNLPSIPQSPSSTFSPPSARPSPGSNKSSPGTSAQPTPTSNGCVSKKQASPSAMSSKSDTSVHEAMEEDAAPSMRSKRNRASTSSNKSTKQVSPSAMSSKSGTSVHEAMEEDAAPSIRSRRNRASTSSTKGIKQVSPSAISSKSDTSAPEAMEEDTVSTMRSRQNRASTSSDKSTKQVSPSAMSSKSDNFTPDAMEDDTAPTMRSRRNRASTSSQQVSPSTMSSKSDTSVPESVDDDTASSSSSLRARQSCVSTSSSNSEASTSQQKTTARRNKKKK